MKEWLRKQTIPIQEYPLPVYTSMMRTYDRPPSGSRSRGCHDQEQVEERRNQATHRAQKNLVV